MNPYYPILLSPLKRGNVVIKNRMGMSKALGAYVTGTESKTPADCLLPFMEIVAQNAAIVTCQSPYWPNPHSRPIRLPDGREVQPRGGIDLTIMNNQILYAKIAEAIHNHGALACMSLMDIEPSGWQDFNEIPAEYLDEMIEDFAQKCQLYQRLGYDMGSFYMSYGNSLLAKSLSPLYNRREDKYGGSTMSERAALSMAVFRRVRETCGKEFLIEVQISGRERDGGYTTEDLIEYARLADREGLIDILQLRSWDMDYAHPLGFSLVEAAPETLSYAEALKKSGVSILIAPVGGFQNPDLNEKWLREGKADMIYMGRAFLCDNHYTQKIAEGRKEDIIPCLRCNQCHTRPGDPNAGCAVNPEHILAITSPALFVPPRPAERPKKVAVIGGGPAGMEAALIASQRGHRVTLFEKSAALGGQMKHADYAAFKWPLKQFKDYMVYQLEKSAVEIRLNTEAKPAEIQAENFEAVIYAAGARPLLPDIPGADGARVMRAAEVFGREAELGKRVVVVGGSEMGTEAGMYLAQTGHEVTVLTRQRLLAHNAQFVHYRHVFEDAWKSLQNFHFVTDAETVEIGENFVRYRDKEGKILKLEADSVVVNGGMESVQDGIFDFAAATDWFRAIGDCKKPSQIRPCMKAGYTAGAMV